MFWLSVKHNQHFPNNILITVHFDYSKLIMWRVNCCQSLVLYVRCNSSIKRNLIFNWGVLLCSSVYTLDSDLSFVLFGFKGFYLSPSPPPEERLFPPSPSWGIAEWSFHIPPLNLQVKRHKNLLVSAQD